MWALHNASKSSAVESANPFSNHKHVDGACGGLDTAPNERNRLPGSELKSTASALKIDRRVLFECCTVSLPSGTSNAFRLRLTQSANAGVAISTNAGCLTAVGALMRRTSPYTQHKLNRRCGVNAFGANTTNSGVPSDGMALGRLGDNDRWRGRW